MADETQTAETKTLDAERTNTTTGTASTEARQETEQRNEAEKQTAEQASNVEAPKPAEPVTEQRMEEVKGDVTSAIATMEVGDHFAQKFANNPANPQPAPGLDPDLPKEKQVRLEISDSDNPDPANPKVCYVDPVMVGDYLRAGWRRPDA